MQFIDTNIFLRYLTKDDPAKAERCFNLFKRAKDRELQLTTSESVIAEVVFVLASRQLYKLTHQEVRIRMYPLISVPGLKIPFKKQILRALDLYAANPIDFEDALTVASMERHRIDEIYSYDKDFDTIRGAAIRRMVP